MSLNGDGSLLFSERLQAQERPGLVASSRNRPGYDNAASSAVQRRGRRRGVTRKRNRRELELDQLQEMLRNQPGVNVRLPSHIAPPFRAVAIANEFDTLLLSADNTTFRPSLGRVDGVGAAGDGLLRFASFQTSAAAIPTGGPTVFPKGWLGVLTAVMVLGALPIGTGAADVNTLSEWTFERDGLAVPGYEHRKLTLGFSATAGAGLDTTNLQDPIPLGGVWIAPVHLEPGHTYGFSVRRHTASVAIQVHCRAYGWMYPVRQSAPGILGTLVD